MHHLTILCDSPLGAMTILILCAMILLNFLTYFCNNVNKNNLKKESLSY